MDARLDQAFKAMVDKKGLPAAGGIIMDKTGKVLWRNAFGTVNVLDPQAAPFTADTPHFIFSCTKLVTVILALQLVEEGKLSLSDPVEKYDPEFAEIKILDGTDAEGKPKLRAPKTKPTILHLMTHTTGLAYDFFSPEILMHRIAVGQQPASTMSAGKKWPFQGPFIFEPGQEYNYGTGIDCLGFVIENIEGKKIAQVLEERISKPLGLKNTTNQLTIWQLGSRGQG